MPKPKERMINVRLAIEIHEQFKLACELRGASMSSLLHQFVVRTIREEREIDPKAFAELRTHKLSGPIRAGKIRVQRDEKKKTGT